MSRAMSSICETIIQKKPLIELFWHNEKPVSIPSLVVDYVFDIATLCASLQVHSPDHIQQYGE